MVRSTRGTVRILDLYFDEPTPDTSSADLVRYNHFSGPVLGAAYCTAVWTMLLDISSDPNEMLAKMKDHTRYKIRRAEKDNLRYEQRDGTNPSGIERFADHYDRYASLKGLPKISRKHYAALAKEGALDLSFISDASGEVLVASSCIVTRSRVRGLHLAGAFRATTDPSRRSLVGRANRYLRWRDILRFREAGVRIFDFGGWYTGTGEAVRTNEFKSEFCGQVVREFIAAKPLTWRGRLGLAALGWQQHFTSRKTVVSAGSQPNENERSLPASV